MVSVFIPLLLLNSIHFLSVLICHGFLAFSWGIIDLEVWFIPTTEIQNFGPYPAASFFPLHCLSKLLPSYKFSTITSVPKIIF